MSRPRKHPDPGVEKVYGRCRSCRFWVTPQDLHCANCGLVAPHPKAESSFVPMFLGFVCGGGLLAGVSWMGSLPLETMMWSFLWGGCAGAPFGTVVDGFRRDRHHKKDCLQTYERTIKLRLQEIDGVLGRIEMIRGRLGAAPGPELQRVAAVLHSAEQVYPEHRDRYRLKLFEIDLVRWQNSVEPLGYAIDGLTFEQCERRLDDLGVLQKRGDVLAQSWQGAGLGSIAAQEMRMRLNRGMALCQQVRQSLITRQTLAVVSGVRALETESTLGAGLGGNAGLDLLTARAEFGEFVQGLSVLEAEHYRLEAELEVNRLGGG